MRALTLATALACAACAREKVTQAECDALVDRYTELALRESFPDASAELVASQKSQVRALAARDPALAKCAEQVTPAARACAMAAATPDAFERCLAR